MRNYIWLLTLIVCLTLGCAHIHRSADNSTDIMSALATYHEGLQTADTDLAMSAISKDFFHLTWGDHDAYRAMLEKLFAIYPAGTLHLRLDDADITYEDGRARVYPVAMVHDDEATEMYMLLQQDDDGAWRLVGYERNRVQRGPFPEALTDYSWVRGANYIPSYAANDVEMWTLFDPEVIDRELGYAEQVELNSLRVFLQYHVYQHQRERFLDNLSTFVDICERHSIKPMLVLFDSCFGISPSLTSGELWVANPGPDRTNRAFYPEGERYVRDVVELFSGDDRILFWDIMNEPESTQLMDTAEGRKRVTEFVQHFCRFVNDVDDEHPTTIAVGPAMVEEVAGLVDVMSIHCYPKSVEGFYEQFDFARQQAEYINVPLIISETCAPAWDCTFEMMMPLLAKEKVGFYFWELMIARTNFSRVTGLFNPDGTVRSLSEAEAVLGRPVPGLKQRVIIPRDDSDVSVGLMTTAYNRMASTPTNGENYHERLTFLEVGTEVRRNLGDKNEQIAASLVKIRQALAEERYQAAFSGLDAALTVARDAFVERWAKP